MLTTLLQMFLGAIALVAVVFFLKGNSEFSGCYPVLAFVFAIPFVLIMVWLERVSDLEFLNPLLSWAGGFRFIALGGFAGMLLAISGTLFGWRSEYVRSRNWAKRKLPDSTDYIVLVFRCVTLSLFCAAIAWLWQLIGGALIFVFASGQAS